MARVFQPRIVVIAAAGLLLILLASGCSAARTAPIPASAPAAAPIERMGAQDKRSMIASSFPIEVPVPAGQVIRGEAQGNEAWVYRLVLDSSAENAAAWYVDAYTGVEWQIIGDETSGDTRSLAMTKGAAESEVTLKSLGAAQTQATVVVGVGTSVLNTQ